MEDVYECQTEQGVGNSKHGQLGICEESCPKFAGKWNLLAVNPTIDLKFPIPPKVQALIYFFASLT